MPSVNGKPLMYLATVDIGDRWTFEAFSDTPEGAAELLQLGWLEHKKEMGASKFLSPRDLMFLEDNVFVRPVVADRCYRNVAEIFRR